MQNNKTPDATLMALQASAMLERGPNESRLNHATRCYEVGAKLKRTIPDPDPVLAATVRAAVQARLDASRKKSAATQARYIVSETLRRIARPTPAIISPTGAVARRIAANADKKIPLSDVPDSKLIESATHRSAPEAGRAEAIAELARRGFAVAKNGVISRSLKKITK
ncbi:MAG: hypothetical protein ORN51_12055 [Akkermansiaceae bacterium]|nr:hypothetical protein [Akkermansiaceae bacterium]